MEGQANIQPFFESLYNYNIEAFKAHLQLPNNNRILFSGKFGIGKSTFLDRFFSNEQSYNTYHLYPVNYSIANNDDIFQYLKYDILIEMLKKKIEIEDTDLDFWYSLPLYARKNIPELTSQLLHIIPLLGKEGKDGGASAAMLGVLNLYNKAKSFHEKEIKGKSDDTILEAFMKDIETNKDSIYSYDPIVQIIEKKISREAGKRSILILDDLDRIDPDHIFRILNVFAAHYDDKSKYRNNNKFGFDQILLVCDVDNIRSIFSNRFGVDADFNGYTDKFYSVEIFRFDNRSAIQNAIKECLECVQYNFSRHSAEESMVFHRNVSKPLFALLTSFYKYNLISLRGILRLHGYQFFVEGEIIVFSESMVRPLMHCPQIVWIRILLILMGSEASLLEAIDRIQGDGFLESDMIDYFCEQLTLFLSTRHHQFDRNSDQYYFYIDNLSLDVTMDRENYSIIRSAKVRKHTTSGSKPFNIEDFKFLFKKAVIRNGYLTREGIKG